MTKGTPTYPINVVYTSAPGLFTGAAVDVLGVKVGTVTGVQNMGDKVHVDPGRGPRDQDPVVGLCVPRRAPAAGLARRRPEPRLHRRALPRRPAPPSPQDHTAVPVSTDEVLKELQHTLNALDPHAVGNLVSNLATDLDGQGANLNKLIASAAGTVQLLADKGNDLGQLNGTLAQLTGTLDTDTGQIEQLVAAVRHGVDHAWPSTRASSTTPSRSWRAPARAWSACWCPTSSRSRRTWGR